MTDTTTPLASVEVAVDPRTAFTAFTQEMDLWWVRGPINYYDSGRALARTCEPGVGGRLMEVYDADTGDGLELGRITVWEPGVRLAWQSSVDDVAIEVRFSPVGDGVAASTLVSVEATIPAGGVDKGGTAWLRVVPKWFGRWCDRRSGAPRVQPSYGLLGTGIYYERPAAAARWLAEVFGLESPDPVPTEADPLPEGHYGHPWIEFRVGNSCLMVFKQYETSATARPATQETWVFVADLDAHLARSTAGGAVIVEGVRQTGFRAYVAEDLEGHRWTFAQANPLQLASV